MKLIQLFRMLWARRLIILIATLGCLTAAAIGGSIIPPRYKAESRLMLNVIKRDPVTGEMIASGFARAYIKTQIELIKDYRIAGRAADALGWTSSPVFAAQYAQRSKDDSRDFRRWVSQRLIDGTNAELVEGSNILEISYNSASPEQAAKIADAIRRAYVDQALAFKREDAASNSAWFRGQAERIRLELRTAEKRKSDFERANGIILDESGVDDESKRLAALASTSAMPAAPGISISQPNPMAAQLAQADAAIASAEKIYGPNHPDLINMRRQRAAMASSAGNVAPTAMGATGPSLASLYGAQQSKVLAQRGKVDEARQLATDVAVLRDQYQKTATRAADLQQQGEVDDSGLTLLGSAVAPQTPSFPNWPLLIFGSLGVGIGLGILVALILELLTRRVRGVEDLSFDNVPVLGQMTSRPEASPRKRLLDLFKGRRDMETA
jgi:uncharacterized protein involved in exopolysaccharide biosynthesis